MPSVEEAVKYAESIAADDSHGYDQPGRMGQDYDCSSLVGRSLVHAGFDYPTPSPSTRTMGEALKAIGFEWHDGVSGVQRGDILWKTGHTAFATSSTMQVEAAINESGGISGGKKGDQTGREIRTARISSTAWQGYYRYEGEEELTDEDIQKIAEAVWNFDQNGTLMRDRIQGTDEAANAAKTEVLRTDDPSGRGMECTTHEHTKWIAKVQQDTLSKIQEIDAEISSLAEDIAAIKSSFESETKK